MPRIALLSNVNMNMVIRLLQREVTVWQTEGYGNELGILMNPGSSYAEFQPEYTFLVIDLMEFLEHDPEPETAKQRIDAWFDSLESVLKPETVYYVSDVWLWGTELSVFSDTGRKSLLEGLWQSRLDRLRKVRGNVRILPYRQIPERLGEENAFSLKMWYLGKILLSNEAQKRLAGLILDQLRIEERIPKKVLLLDLDNTLWGGLAGENDLTPVELSEEHTGLAYKNLQRVLFRMENQGVLLAVVSKNNEQDAMEILEKHPHMVLRPQDFAAMRINWKPKHENIREIAEELNLGTDSFVFWDDSPSERQLVREMLPEVEVPDFPANPEELASAMAEVYRLFFQKPTVTEEDREKTAQYVSNAARKQLEQSAGSFEEYLESLQIVVTRVEPGEHVERLTQLVNKTNQFNLTTKRYTRGQIEMLLQDSRRQVYLYAVTDRFGDSGIVAAVVAELNADTAVLEEFVMSCRVMGKNIEYAILDDVERDLTDRGVKRIQGIYIPTEKNKPVEKLYGQLGYRRTESGREQENPVQSAGQAAVYELLTGEKPERRYHVCFRHRAAGTIF
ncbi:MAG: HAD-IIIC family phosphatase [bacterium]|nr:HAD-IIIC family phosphatase [bacterium]